MRSLLTDKCVCEEVRKPARRIEGGDQVVELFRVRAKVISDFTGKVPNTLAEDGRVALEVTWEGAVSGPTFGDFSPTGRPQSVSTALFFSFESGRIDTIRHYFDSLALFQLLGVNT